MTGGIGSVNGATQATVRPSRMIQILAALTAAYLGVALYYAGTKAFGTVDVTLYIAAGATVAFVALASQVRWRFGAVLALSLSFVAQLAWAGWASPAPIFEDESLLLQARTVALSIVQSGEFAAQELYESPSPSATMLYAVAIALFGEDLSVLRVLSAGLWTAQAWLVWRICEEVSELRARGFAAALLFGLAPAVVVFGSVPSVEAVFGFFALMSVWLVLSHRRRGLGLSAFLSGVFGAFAFLAHPSGVGYVAGLVAVLLVGLSWEKRWPGRWRMGMAVLACVGGFALGVAPQAALNYAIEGRVSVAPGPAIGLELAYGTNRESSGGHSAEDSQTFGFDVAQGVELREAERAARGAAMERISADPEGFFVFAMTVKMRQVWDSTAEVLDSTTQRPGREPGEFEATAVGAAAPSVIDGVYLAILALATLGALRLTIRAGGVRDPTRWVLVLVAILCLASAYLFLWARPRANMAFTPLLVLLGPIAFAKLPRVVTARIEAREREAAEQAREEEKDKAFDLAQIHKPKPVDPEVAKRPAEERLAMVLKGMSKPPRPANEEEGGAAASSDRPRQSAGAASEAGSSSGSGSGSGSGAGASPTTPPVRPRKERDASA